MGWKHMPLARRVPGLTNTEKLVLITYAECANADDGDSTYIGQATIARELGKDRSDINKATKRLQELGYISKRPKYVYPPDKPPRRTSNTVTVHYNKMLEAVEAYQATLRVGKSATDSDDAWRTEIVDNSRAAHVENASSGNSTASDVLGLSQHGVGTIPTVRGDYPHKGVGLSHTLVGTVPHKKEVTREPTRELAREETEGTSFTVNAAASTPTATPKTSTEHARKTATTATTFNSYKDDPRNTEARAALREVIVTAAKLKDDRDKYDDFMANDFMAALVEHYSDEVAEYSEHEFNDVPPVCEDPYQAGKWLTTLLRTAARRRGIDVRPRQIIDDELAADNDWQDRLARIDEATANDNTEFDQSA